MKPQMNPVLRTSPLQSTPSAASYAQADARQEPAPADKAGGRARPDDHLVSLTAPTTMEAEQYRTLGLMLEQRRHSGLLQVVGISSPTMGDGKTLTAINLAGALAQPTGSRVLLIDGDFRKPSVPQQLGLRESTGLGIRDAIVDPALALKDIVRRLPGWNLSIAMAGRSQVMPHDIFKSSRFTELIDEARREYEWVVMDTAPLILAPDCLMLGRTVDGFVIVVRANKTSREEVAEALNILGPAKLLGLVFNDDDRLLRSYGYGHYYSASAHAR
ncbi:MAG TPA: CpsD/CapB family tyrosine-protein kinase [Nitrospira sp.]|nr:CpsD/CapB family tyrosine-protein kinase [Nitrospira sp.]